MTWADTAPAWPMVVLSGVDRSAARRWPPPHLPIETAAGRCARHVADRRHLARLGDRLLADVGLTRDAASRGLPCKDATAASTRRHRA